MPKPRGGVRRQDKEFIQISPWQEKKQHVPLDQQQHNAALVPLVTLTSRSDPQPQQPAPLPREHSCRQAPEAVSTGWMNHRGSAQQQQQQQQQQDDNDLTEEEWEQGSTACAVEQPHSSMQVRHNQAIDDEDDWLQPVHHPSHPPHHKHQHQQLRKQASQGEQQDEQEEEELQDGLLQQHRQKQEPHAPFRLRPSQAGLSGLCRLALLPGGHLTGHLVDTCTRKCYGLMGTRVAVGGGGCRHDEDVEFLCMSLLTFGSSSCEVSAAVVKTGGDYARIEPAEEGDLERFPELRMRMRSRSSCPSASSNATSADEDSRSTSKLAESSAHTSGAPQSDIVEDSGDGEGVAASAGCANTRPSGANNRAENSGPGSQATSLLAEEEGLIGAEQLLATRIHFAPSVLHAGSQADQHLAAFAPKLKGRGAAVTMGTMRVDGLPEDFA